MFRDASPSERTQLCLPRTEPISSSDSDLISDTAYTHTTRSLLRRYIPSGVVLIRSRRCGRDGVRFLATYGKPLVHSGPHNQQAMLRKFLRNFAFSRGVLANLPMTTKVMPLRLSPASTRKNLQKIVALRARKFKRNALAGSRFKHGGGVKGLNGYPLLSVTRKTMGSRPFWHFPKCTFPPAACVHPQG